jgi:omega-amidase
VLSISRSVEWVEKSGGRILMGPNATSEQKRLRIALLHLAPVPGDLEGNRNAVVSAIERAVDAGAGWIITPELVLCGYTFIEQLGTDWIVPQPDDWMTRVCTLAARHRVTVFLSCPERDPLSGRLHNSVFIISDDGTIVGRHRKINTLPVGSEAWSSPGTNVAPIEMPGFGKVGILICADACSPEIARQLRESGARLLVSAAAWAPGLHGPNGEWERATLDTGLALVVCNRTGPDLVLDFTGAESVVALGGRRVLSLSSARSTIFLFDWDADTERPASTGWRQIDL